MNPIRYPVKNICHKCRKTFVVESTHRLQKFCSHPCASLFHSGKNNHNWTGGKRITTQGYVQIMCKDHFNAWPSMQGRYKLEHRVIMEKHLQRPLLYSEHVHHLNGIKTDNRLSNLSLISSSDHSYLHHPISRAPIACLHCSKIIFHPDSDITKFCSQSCCGQHKHFARSRMIRCVHCHKSLRLPLNRFSAKRHFCSMTCRSKHHDWSGIYHVADNPKLAATIGV